MNATLRRIIFSVACLFTLTANAADILLAGFSADAVIRYDGTSGALVGSFATNALMDGPTALVYNPAGELLVLNEFSLNVLRFNGATGAFIDTFIPSAALGSVGITDPDDMEIGTDGNLYITSHFNTGGTNISKFSGTTGAYLGAFALSPPTHHAHGLAFGPLGDLFQGNAASDLVERFDGTTGTSLGTFAAQPSMVDIADLAFGPTRLYVTVDGGGGVARFNATTGAFIDYLIPPGAGASYWGILVDSGFLYTANTVSGTVKKFDATTGAFIGDFITGAPGAFDLVPMQVPEPGSLGLSVTGILMMAAYRRRAARRYS